MVKNFLFIFLAPAAFVAQSLSIHNPLRFLALGDSYTIGQSVTTNERWPAQLVDSLLKRGVATDTLRIIATTGWRTDNLLNAITNQGLKNQNYNLVSLLIGVNNLYQNMPINQYTFELPRLIDSAIVFAGGIKSRVFMVSIPDYAFTPFGQTSNPAQISSGIDLYNQINKHFADSFQIKYFDITAISRLGNQQPNYVATDGLHPSGIQYGEWVKLMLSYIDSEILTGTYATGNKGDWTVSISPNPASNSVKVRFSDEVSSAIKKIEVINVLGKTILSSTISGHSGELNLAELPPGLYSVKINCGETYVLRKLIKTVE